MPLPCPLCRAVNDAGLACRRCRADLSLLFALEDQRAAELVAARFELAQGRPDPAFDRAHAAETMRAGADASRVLAAAALLRRDFAAAWREYRRARSHTGE